MEENTQKALDSAISQIEKDHGKGALMKLGAGSAYPDIESISTGSLTLDTALGIGGLPKGRVVEIYGPESSGKTTMALQVIAQAQKQGGTAAFIDAEHALDPKYAENLGVNIDELLLSQPDSGEQALEIADTLVRSGAISTLVSRFCCSIDAQGGNRWRYGRLTHGFTSSTNVTSFKKIDCEY